MKPKCAFVCIFLAGNASHEEIVLRIGHFPAFVIPESALTLIIPFRLQASSSHVERNLLDFLVQAFNVRLQFLQMHFAVRVDQPRFLENAIHVALEFLVFVNFAVTEFPDRL